MKRKISLALVVLVMFAVLTATAAARGQYLGQLRIVNCDEWVTLRASASTYARSVDRVPLGAFVDAYAYNSEFCECYYRGRHGYILTSYLSGMNPSDYLGQMRVVNCNEFVTLRDGPSTQANSVTKVPLGQVVEAYAFNDEFFRCEYRGMDGFILASYLEPVDGNYEYSPYGDDIYDDYDYDYEELYVPLVIESNARGEWNKVSGDKLNMRVKVTNTSRVNTVKAFELYMYAEDVWGERIYGDTTIYYATTTKKVAPGKSVFSDYMTLPDRSRISTVYVGIKKIIFTDGTIRENDSMNYSYWNIVW